jgi:hypothetical protein
VGKVEFTHSKVLSPVVQPLIEVIAMSAVQLMIWVVVLPMARSPKLTGCEHWSGNATGEPRQMTFPLESVT